MQNNKGMGDEGWIIERCYAVDETGANYWVSNGFIFFKAENRPVQLPLLERYKKWRSFKRQAKQELRTKQNNSKQDEE